METIKCNEKSFGKETQKQIKKIFKQNVKMKKINEKLVIIKSEEEKKIGSWVKVDSENCIIIVV